jgi:hypothetical protein
MPTKKNLAHNLIDIDNIYEHASIGIQNILEQINENNGLEIDLADFKYSFEFNNRRHFITIDTDDHIIEMGIYNESFVNFTLAKKTDKKKFKIEQAIEFNLFKYEKFNTYINSFIDLLLFTYSNMNSLIINWYDKDVNPSEHKGIELSANYCSNNYEVDINKSLSIQVSNEYGLSYKTINNISTELIFIDLKDNSNNCHLLGDRETFFNI